MAFECIKNIAGQPKIRNLFEPAESMTRQNMCSNFCCHIYAITFLPQEGEKQAETQNTGARIGIWLHSSYSRVPIGLLQIGQFQNLPRIVCGHGRNAVMKVSLEKMQLWRNWKERQSVEDNGCWGWIGPKYNHTCVLDSGHHWSGGVDVLDSLCEGWLS